MKVLKKMKDGGPESTVTGYFLLEWKRLLTVVLLRFDGDSRDAYHSHAFNTVSWVLRGSLEENLLGASYEYPRCYWPSLRPVVTRRETFHKVHSRGRTWVLSLRGPWAETWSEYTRDRGLTTLSHGRRVAR